MKLKNNAEKAFKMYFVLVTLITVVIMILGLLFDSERTFNYQVLASPLIYAALGVIPILVFDKEEEVSVRELVFRRIARLILLEAVFMGIAFYDETIPTEKRWAVIGVAVGIVVVYSLAFLIEYILEITESKKMNEYLYRYQKNR